MSDTVSNDTGPVTYAVSDEQSATVLLLMLVQGSVSSVAAAFGVFVFFYIRYKYPRLANRVTFRLALATMISDFFVCLSLLITVPAAATPDNLACKIFPWSYVFASLMSIFFPTCIAINLQVVFIYGYRGRRELEKYYYIVSIGLAAFLSLIGFSDHIYGFNVPEGTCFFRDSGTKVSVVWQWSIFYAWEILCILYCSITLICVAVKLYKTSTSTNISGQTMTSRYEKNVLRNKAIITLAVKKVIWYPIVPILTQGPNFLVETDIYVNQKINYAFLILSTLCASQGLLNTLVFMQDFAVSRAYRSMRLSWWDNYVNKYEELYPHLSRNKASDVVGNEVKSDKKQQSQKQPSFGERLRYNLLTSLFSKPKGNEVLAEYDQFMTIKDDEETTTIQSVNDKNDGDASAKGDDSALDQFNKDVLSKL